MKIVTVMLIVLIILVSIVWMAKLQWHSYTALQFQKVKHSPASPSSIDPEEITTLPPIVQKYFRLVLENRAPLIQIAELSQTGGFRAKPEMKSWSAMHAEQRFSTSPRGFVWCAEISMLPGVPITICDSYIEGEGSMKGRLLSLVPIINTSTNKALNEAALQRYLAEAVWFPTALLPSQGVRWKKIDERRATATITDHGMRVSMEYTFNETGEIVSVYTPQRYREVDGEYIATPWRGRLSDYTRADGFLVPTYAEAAWLLGEDTYTYWRADIKKIDYIYR